MNLARLTGSRLELAGACLYPFREDVPWVDVPGRASRIGSAFDAIVSARINGMPAPSEPEDDIAEQVWALVHVAEEQDPHGLSTNGWRAQVAYALDPMTGEARELGRDIGRDYAAAGLRPHETGLTCDRVKFYPSTEGRRSYVEVRDWKTGRSAPTLEAKKHAQLRALGYAAAKANGCMRALIAIDAVTPYGLLTSEYVLDEWELREVCALDLRSIVEDMRPDVQPSPGPHCDELYCPARAACPARRRSAELAAPEEVRRLPLLPSREALAAPSLAAEVYRALVALDALTSTWWQIVKEHVDATGPLDLGDGREYVTVQEVRESIVVDSPALAALEEHFGGRYGEALRTTITKKAIGELARSVAGTGKPGAAKEREVLDALRAAGSVRSKAITTHEVRAIKKGRAA